MSLEKVLAHFLSKHCKGPLILGLSGGPDSMALFHLLLEMAYPFQVAHVNHGWRIESADEARTLQTLCESKGIGFYSVKLKPIEARNMEEQARIARMAFFKEVVVQSGAIGIMLAHHADDHAETVLKRLFEGASLPKLRGLQPISDYEGLTIFRPLLTFKKEAILRWLKEKNIDYFIDHTNEDPRFLRTRLRSNIMPILSQHFGKEVAVNLCRLGESAAELSFFLEECTAPFLEKIQHLSNEVQLSFQERAPTSSFLWQMVLRQFFSKLKLSPSVLTLKAIQLHLEKGSFNKMLKVGKKNVCIHKKTVSVKI